jgi:hypothetical protein
MPEKLNLNRRGKVKDENNSFRQPVAKYIIYPTGRPNICARKIDLLNCGRNVRERKYMRLTMLI